MTIEHQDTEFLTDILAALGLPPGAAVLDIGTGWGLMAITLATEGFQVTTGEPEGDDWHATHHADWQESADEQGIRDRINYRHFSAEEIPFEDNHFPGVFMLNTLHHVGFPHRAVGEALRVLQPDGVFCVFEMNRKGADHLKAVHGVDHGVMDTGWLLSIEDADVDRFEGSYVDAYVIRPRAG